MTVKHLLFNSRVPCPLWRDCLDLLPVLAGLSAREQHQLRKLTSLFLHEKSIGGAGGLEVDDTQYHGAVLNKATGELYHFKCRPTLKGLSGQLAKVGKQFPRHSLLKLVSRKPGVGQTGRYNAFTIDPGSRFDKAVVLYHNVIHVLALPYPA